MQTQEMLRSVMKEKIKELGEKPLHGPPSQNRSTNE